MEIAMPAETDNIVRKVIDRVIGGRRRRESPSLRQVERRMVRMRAERTANEAVKAIEEIRLLDPMEVELLGKRRDRK